MKNEAIESQTFAADISQKELDFKESESKDFSKIKLESIINKPI